MNILNCARVRTYYCNSRNNNNNNNNNKQNWIELKARVNKMRA